MIPRQAGWPEPGKYSIPRNSSSLELDVGNAAIRKEGSLVSQLRDSFRIYSLPIHRVRPGNPSGDLVVEFRTSFGEANDLRNFGIPWTFLHEAGKALSQRRRQIIDTRSDRNLFISCQVCTAGPIQIMHEDRRFARQHIVRVTASSVLGNNVPNLMDVAIIDTDARRLGQRGRGQELRSGPSGPTLSPTLDQARKERAIDIVDHGYLRPEPQSATYPDRE